MQHYNLNDILVRLRLSLGADVLCCLPDVFLHCSDVCFKATLSVLVDVRLDKICTAMWIITYHLMKGVASEFSGSFFLFHTDIITTPSVFLSSVYPGCDVANTTYCLRSNSTVGHSCDLCWYHFQDPCSLIDVLQPIVGRVS